MLVLLLVLAVGAHGRRLHLPRPVRRRGSSGEFWKGAIFNAPGQPRRHDAHHAPTWVMWAPLVVVGDRPAGRLVLRLPPGKEGSGARIAARRGGPLYDLLLQQVVLRRALPGDLRAAGRSSWATCSGRSATRRSSTASAPTGSSALSAQVGTRRPGRCRPATSTTTPS